MKAAIPVPYIIALILGVVVIALLGYWFVSSAGKGSSIGSEAECAARKVEFCATQTLESWVRQDDICGNERSLTAANCKSFCGTIIPGWKSIPDGPCK